MSRPVSLVDMGVWFSLTQPTHAHHTAASHWFRQQADQSVAFCRLTQMGLLRLLTQSPAMLGRPFTQRAAWGVVDELVMDVRVLFLDEPAGLQEVFRRVSDRDEISPKRWTDDYLAAFAETSGLSLATFDRALAMRVSKSTLLTL